MKEFFSIQILKLSFKVVHSNFKVVVSASLERFIFFLIALIDLDDSAIFIFLE